jgi:hypothetical protein
MFTGVVYRFGDKNRHSYIVGVFQSLSDAINAVVAEEKWRGGKYAGEVLKTEPNALCPAMGYFETIWESDLFREYNGIS